MAHDYGIKERVQHYTPYTGKPIRVEKPFKKVILVNAKDCKDRITVSHVRNRLVGTGWFEWEDLLSHWLVEAVVDAVRNGSDEADISKLFTCELQGEDRTGPFSKSQHNINTFLMGRLFECLEENESVMRVRIIEKAIC